MSGSTLGTLFTVTTFGESHGPAIGCVIDGCPPGMELSDADIQPDLDRRKPGTSRHVTSAARTTWWSSSHLAQSEGEIWEACAVNEESAEELPK